MFYRLAKATIGYLTGKRAQSTGYRSLSIAPHVWNLEERPPFTLHMIELMEYDDTVTIALGVRDGILSHAEIEVTDGPPKVCDYVAAQWRQLWAVAGWQMLRAKLAGFTGFEIMYDKDECGRPNITGAKDFATRDVRPLIYAGNVVGLTVNNLRGRQSDPAVETTPQTMKIVLPSPKGLWLTHLTRQGSHYGNSALRAAYPSWYEKWMRGGAVKLRQLRMVKDAWIGDVIKYPDRKIINQDGTETGFRDIAAEILDNRYSGGAIGLPSTRDAQGNAEWEYQPPTTVQGASQIFEWMDQLDESIRSALQTPSEVIKAAENGGIGGVGGRSVPLVAFFSTLQKEIDDLVQQVNEQILKNLVRIGCHLEPSYKIRVKKLTETMSKIMGGGEQKPAASPGMPGFPQQPQQSRPSFGGWRNDSADATDSKPVQFSEGKSSLAYIRGRSPSKAGRFGAIVGGVYYRPGEWVSSDAMKYATPNEVLQFAEFSEAEHPRSSDGQFAPKAGGSGERTKIGKGSTGDVFRKGDRVYKQGFRSDGSGTPEAKIYNRLKGVPGISPGVEEAGGEISTPFYKNIISVDAVPDAKRRTLAPVILKNKATINAAVSALSEIGGSYDDPLQFGFTDSHSMELLDFSNVSKSSRDSAVDENLDLLKQFYKTFGAENEAARVSDVHSVLRSVREIAAGNDDFGTYAEDLAEFGDGTFEKLSSQLDGKPAKYAYYATNGRHVGIGGIAQTEPKNGIKVILSPERLSDSDLKQWEITPVVHPAQAAAKPMQFGGADTGLRWITIGGRKDGSKNHKGGFPVQIDADGTIVKCGGPGALVGTKIDDVGSHFYRESLKRSKEREKKHEAKHGKLRDLDVGQRRSYQEFAKGNADYFGLSLEEYNNAVEDVWGEKSKYHAEREEAKAAARKATGLDSRRIQQLENKGLDHATAKQFDVIGRELASQYPVLGWGAGYDDQHTNGPNVDYGAELWELIREGKGEIPSRNSEEFHKEVFDFLDYQFSQASDYKQPDWLADVEF